MDCKRAEKLFFIYANGELKGKEKKAFEEHIKDCLTCRKNYERIVAFNKGIELTELKTSPEMDFELSKKISSYEEKNYYFLFKQVLYPLIFMLGLLIGILLGTYLSDNKENKTFTILKKSTFQIEPYLEEIKIEEVLDERE